MLTLLPSREKERESDCGLRAENFQFARESKMSVVWLVAKWSFGAYSPFEGSARRRGRLRRPFVARRRVAAASPLYPVAARIRERMEERKMRERETDRAPPSVAGNRLKTAGAGARPGAGSARQCSAASAATRLPHGVHGSRSTEPRPAARQSRVGAAAAAAPACLRAVTVAVE